MTTLNHVAVTVRDIDASGPWYAALFGADPLLDEHTDGGFRHLVWAFDNGTLFGIHQRHFINRTHIFGGDDRVRVNVAEQGDFLFHLRRKGAFGAA